VKTPEGEIFDFQDLPEATVSKLDGVQHADQLDIDVYSCSETRLEYKDGKLWSFTFGAGPLEIGSQREGPFHGFPMSRDEIHEILGEANREGRASKPMFRFW
jgi:hypothetical protein